MLGLTDWLPLDACTPLHAPLAVQDVAFVEDQFNVVLWPTVIVVDTREIDTVGAGREGPVGPVALEPPPQPVNKKVVTSKLLKAQIRIIVLLSPQ
jgi:hypothetical protein